MLAIDPTDSSPSPPLAPAVQSEVAKLLAQSIAHQLRVRWIYNRTAMQAAPQILYIRDEALFVDAVILEKAGIVPAELKIGSFKLRGLRGLALMSEASSRFRDFDPQADRYAGGTLAVIDA